LEPSFDFSLLQQRNSTPRHSNNAFQALLRLLRLGPQQSATAPQQAKIGPATKRNKSATICCGLVADPLRATKILQCFQWGATSHFSPRLAGRSPAT
jgi:hypothetical protein